MNGSIARNNPESAGALGCCSAHDAVNELCHLIALTREVDELVQKCC